MSPRESRLFGLVAATASRSRPRLRATVKKGSVWRLQFERHITDAYSSGILGPTKQAHLEQFQNCVLQTICEALSFWLSLHLSGFQL